MAIEAPRKCDVDGKFLQVMWLFKVNEIKEAVVGGDITNIGERVCRLLWKSVGKCLRKWD
jgi:hypothetical protein